MKWTNEPPEDEGWYWVQSEWGGFGAVGPTIVQVVRHRRLYAWCGPVREGVKSLTRYANAKWAGPIQPPKEADDEVD